MNIAVLLSIGSSLSSWSEYGILDREIAIYKLLAERYPSGKITIVSYSQLDQYLLPYLSLPRNLEVIYPNIPARNWLHQLQLIRSTILRHLSLNKVDLILTHQLEAAIPLIQSNMQCLPSIVLRCGYLPSIHRHLTGSFLNYKSFLYRLLEILILKKAKRIIVSNYNDESVLSRYRSSLTPSSIFVIPNGIDTDRFHPVKEANKSVRKRVLFVGSLRAEKNIEAVITACSKLDLQLDIVGDGPHISKLIVQARSSQASINFLGRVHNSSLPNIYHQYDIFINPSFAEGSPKTVLEAQACGLLCIVSPIVQHKEIVKHLYSGFITSSFSASSFELALEWTFAQPLEVIQSISLAAARSASSQYSFSAILARYLRVLE